MDILEKYVAEFNEGDDELYVENISNAKALTWMRQEIPLFECSNKVVEKIYYFRWWTYRKHIRHTSNGYVITEFMPQVLWSDKETNVINAPVGHQINEGRWLKNSKKYILDYVNYLLEHSKISHTYSVWLIYPLMEFDKLNDIGVDKSLVVRLDEYYKQWEDEHLAENGMFWSFDNYDAMEYSISGSGEGTSYKGLRPTLNSYMCADAYALAYFAQKAGLAEVQKLYYEKYEDLKNKINQKLWKDGFYRAFHFKDDNEMQTVLENKKHIPMELIGYIPWMFNIPPKERDDAFMYLLHKNVFLTDIGITTADMRDEKFLYQVNHECLWNGYVWPFATSQTLTALLNVVRRNRENTNYKNIFFFLLNQYASSHRIIKDDGKEYPWIDEVMHPFTGDWSSRTFLKNRNWVRHNNTLIERGKDYNHSTFCDLVISALTGIEFIGDDILFNPIIPDDWDYFKIENLYIRGNKYTIVYDKTGEQYGVGKGFFVF